MLRRDSSRRVLGVSCTMWGGFRACKNKQVINLPMAVSVCWFPFANGFYELTARALG